MDTDEQKLKRSRLRHELEKRHITGKKFAEASGVTPDTLSRYLTGKKELPDKYLERAAEILDLSDAYLKGMSDEPDRSAPWLPQNIHDVSRQTFRISCLWNFLEQLGVDLEPVLKIGTVTYYRDKKLVWHPDQDDVPDLANDEYLDAIRANCEESSYQIRATYQDQQKMFSYEEFQEWALSMIAMIDMRLADIFHTGYADITCVPVADDLSRAIGGKNRIEW